MQQIPQPGNFFVIFRILQYVPYIAIGLLAVAIAIWIIFGVKKYKWAKMLAIVITVLVVITGLLSVFPLIMMRGPRNFPRDGQQFQFNNQDQFNQGQNSFETNSINIKDYSIDYNFLISV